MRAWLAGGRLRAGEIGWLSVLFAVLTPHTQHRKSLPEDSAVYTYIGWAWQHGLVPYTQLWDHKGPLLYLIERLGAMLVPVPALGVNILDFLATAGSAALMLWIAAELVSRRAVLLLGAGAVLFCAAYSRGGNMTETWAVPFLALAHWAAWRAASGRHARPWWLGAVIGGSAAAILWIRPNMMAFAGLAGIFLVVHTARRDGPARAAVQGASGLAGVGLVSALSLLPYWRDGALPAMKAAYFGYNTAYSQFITRAERVQTLRDFVFELATMPLYVAAIAGWGLLAWALLRRRGQDPAVPQDYRVLLLGSGLIEFLAIQLSGRSYVHYLYNLWPTAFVLAALALRMAGSAPAVQPSEHPSVPDPRLAWLGLFLVVPAALLRYAVDLTGQQSPVGEMAVVRTIDANTLPSDRVAVIGGPEAAYVYLHSRRFATSRYFYTIPITHRAFPDAAAVRAEYVREIVASPPKVIAGNLIANALCMTLAECLAADKAGTDEEGYFNGALPLALQPLLAADYVRASDPDYGFWKVYVRKDVAAANHLPVMQ